MKCTRRATSRPAALWWLGILAMISGGVFCGLSPAAEPDWQVGPVPEALRQRLELAPFYQKHISVAGFPIVGSAKVSDHALREAAWIVRNVVGPRDDLLQAMAANKVRLVVMAWDEYTTDVPEHSRMEPKVFWDRRARGLGATLRNPVVSCAEENLLCYPRDPYSTENILIHEFAHAIHGTAGKALGRDFDRRLRAAFKNATEQGLFKGTYAGTNASEYWAEAVQSWFDNNRENDSLHNHVNTRAELKEYDPELAKLVAEVLGDLPWRYKKPMDRDPAGRAHLAGFDPSKSPRFRWREAALVDKPLVLVQTALGDIEIELEAARAPVTTKNFLRYALEGFYADGTIGRAGALADQPTGDVKVEVIRASANPADGKVLSAHPAGTYSRYGAAARGRRRLDGSRRSRFRPRAFLHLHRRSARVGLRRQRPPRRPGFCSVWPRRQGHGYRAEDPPTARRRAAPFPARAHSAGHPDKVNDEVTNLPTSRCNQFQP
jgi:hypothetical protein